MHVEGKIQDKCYGSSKVSYHMSLCTKIEAFCSNLSKWELI